MIRGFWQSRLAVGGILLVSAVLAAVIAIRDVSMGYPAYIPIVAAVLTLGIGAAAGRLVGNIAANTCNTRLLGLLHVELDPEAFLQAYEAVPGRLKEGSWDRAVASSYLAEGYAAAGRFSEAMATLCPSCTGKPQAILAVKSLYYSSLCSYALSSGDCSRAWEASEELEKIISSQDISPAFAQNMRNQLNLCRERLACLGGEEVDRQWLTSQLAQAAYTLRRLEILETLARYAINLGRDEEAREYLEQMRQQAGKTRYRDWAAQEMNRLKESV